MAIGKMLQGDMQLIGKMKEIIKYQENTLEKREKLVMAFTHNVKYLAHLHKMNSADSRSIKEKLVSVEHFNEQL